MAQFTLTLQLLVAVCIISSQLGFFATCMAVIREKALDRDAFWFGTDYEVRCSNPHPDMILDCLNRRGLSGDNLVTATLGGDENMLEYLESLLKVKYTGPTTGAYDGCHEWQSADYSGHEFDLDFPFDEPISAVYFTDQPMISWTPKPDTYYSLFIMDHNKFYFVYMNIPGNDTSQARVIKSYAPLVNLRRPVSPVAFYLFEQHDPYMGDFSYSGAADFPTTLGSFLQENGFHGPIAMNAAVLKYDEATVSRFAAETSLDNCRSLVQDALRYMPGLPVSGGLSGILNVQFMFDDLTYQYCCETRNYRGETFILDGLNHKCAEPIHLNDQGKLRVSYDYSVYPCETPMEVGSKIAEETLYTFIMAAVDEVDPRIGNSTHPKLHLMMTNVPTPSFELMTSMQDVLVPYLAPHPETSARYIFMFYEQSLGYSTVTLSDLVERYTQPCPLPNVVGRCLFDLEYCAKDQGLNLLAVNWVSVETEEGFTPYLAQYQDCSNVPDFPRCLFQG